MTQGQTFAQQHVGAGAEPAYQVAGLAASEQQFYAVACDPQRPVVVQACAGAGKTWMLVSRILRAMLQGVQPQHILAITFTRKAAGEMRQRLDEWLLQYSQDHCSEADRVQALCQRGLSPTEAIALAPALGRLRAELLAKGQAVEVRTFHGWFAQLLKHAPLSVTQGLGLPLNPEPLEDIAALRQPLLRQFHRAVQRDPTLRADYLGLVARHRRSTVLLWLENAWFRGPELARADAAGNAENAVPPAAEVFEECQGLDDPAQLLMQAPLADDLRQLAQQLGRASKAVPQKAGTALLEALALLDANARLDAVWAALFTKEDTPRKNLGESVLLNHALELLPRLKQWILQQRSHLDHCAMLRLSRQLLADYAALKRQRGWVDMADLERAAEAMLGDSEVAGWVQERLDQRVRQLLIDEFQDTSPLQWQVLHSWLSSYSGAGGGASGQRPPAVFIVGDPKQSIYRFRGAEPRVFEAAQDFVLQGLAGVLLECDHTRRNAPAVVQALNSVFDEAARLDGWGPFRAHTTASAAAGKVSRLPGVSRTAAARNAAGDPDFWRDSLTQARQEPEQLLRAEEAAQAADAVAALLREHGLAPQDVMVLARKRAMLGLVAQALARLGLPHVVAEPLALHQSPEVLDLVALLDVLVSPGHNLSLARALRSPVFGASDADLLGLARLCAQTGRSWLAALLKAAEDPQQTVVSSALGRAARLLGAWADVAPSLTPHELLDRIVHEGEVLPRLAAAVPASRRSGAMHAVNALLASALDHGGGRFSTVFGFVRDLRAGRVDAVNMAPADAVQLLTVHGAKGLEARAVVVVDCDPERRPVQRATVLVDWPVAQPAPRGVAFLRSETQVPPSLQDVWATEEATRQREELNSLYVAMTRARERLVFSRTEARPRTDAYRSWWARVAAVSAPWAPAQAQALVALQDARLPALPGWLPSATRPAATARPGAESLEPALRPALRSSSHPALDPGAARLGQAVHRLLEWVGQPQMPVPAAQWPAASVAAAAAFGLDAGRAGDVLGIARAILQSADCAHFFGGPALRWAGNEVPVSVGGHALRIDRLVALEQNGAWQWWVLDYKLQQRPQDLLAYREQLAAYVAAVRELQPGQRVQGAFITGRGERVLLDL
jgi:ATP-dependent helicase/nuclease subunit A